MSAGRPFRIAFLDGEPPEEAQRAAAQGTVELVDPSRAADPGRVDGVVIGGPIERRAERVTGHLRAGVAVLAAAPLSAEAAEHDALVQDAEEGPGRLLLAYRQRWRPEVAAVCAAAGGRRAGRDRADPVALLARGRPGRGGRHGRAARRRRHGAAGGRGRNRRRSTPRVTERACWYTWASPAAAWRCSTWRPRLPSRTTRSP